MFEEIIKQTQEELKSYVSNKLKGFGYKDIIKSKGFVYAKGEVPVLLVAHLDTVHTNQVRYICYSKDRNIVMSPQGIGGDDRCGVYAILRMLSRFKCHVLFCEDEEVGCKGAGLFTKSKIKPDVNFIIEFDRNGSNDSVFYDCDNEDFEKFINGFGFVTAMGSFSDISDVAPYVGAAAVNLSCGYYNPHTLHEYICMPDLNDTIAKAANIIEHSDKFYKYIEAKNFYSGVYKYDYPYKGNTTKADKYFFTSYSEPKTSVTSGVKTIPQIDDYYDNIYANSIYERYGYVTLGSETLDDKSLYIGEDGYVYREIYDGVSKKLLNAEAFLSDGTSMKFDDSLDIYELSVFSIRKTIKDL